MRVTNPLKFFIWLLSSALYLIKVVWGFLFLWFLDCARAEWHTFLDLINTLPNLIPRKKVFRTRVKLQFDDFELEVKS